jgi:malate dehydrogenase (oxaloacetate-decarboxylating)
VGGMGIPIGKLSLYTLIGGIHPSRTLPIVLDVGTNNQERLRDPEYLGWRHERITGQDYYDFIDQFVQAVKHELPDTCLQWEDFSMAHARPILERYRDELLTFNDDIQGTASVTLGAILSAINVTRKNLRDQQVVIFGAGSASIGVADYLRAAMVSEGLSFDEARHRFWIVNRGGLLLESRTDISTEQRVYAQSDERVVGWPRTLNGKIGLADVIGKVDAGILLGLSTVGGTFTEPIIKEMARKVERPIIFPLSNPTVNSEAVPSDLLRWTEGRALVATGSPFAPVSYGGTTFEIAQCNNVFIFPAVGLGVVASRARRVTDGMMIVAARTLAQHSPTAVDPTCSLLPAVSNLRDVALEIAFAVGREAQNAGVASRTSEDELWRRVHASRWDPVYPSFVG